MYAMETITGKGATPAPFTQSALGQVDAITQDDVIREFDNRGYYHERAAPPAVVVPGVTKADAIKAAVNQSIFAYELPHTAWLGVVEQYKCPQGDYGCPIPASWWPQMIEYTTMVANGILTGKYGMPDWEGLGAVSGGGLGNTWADFWGWVNDNPWLYDTAGNMLKARAQYLTAKDVKDTLKSLIPSDYLTKEDMPAIMAAFRQADVIGPGQDAAFQKGLEAATMTTPSWMMPALIAGGALLVFMLMRK